MSLVKNIQSNKYHPDAFPSNPSILNDEFDGNVLDGKWSWINQVNATATLSNSYLDLHALPSIPLQAIVQPIASSNFNARSKLNLVSELSGTMNGGLILGHSVANKYITWGLFYSSSLFVTRIDWSDPFNGFVASDTINSNSYQYFNIDVSWPTATFQVSNNGAVWANILTSNISGFFPSVPDRVGLYVCASNNPFPLSVAVDWFRVNV